MQESDQDDFLNTCLEGTQFPTLEDDAGKRYRLYWGHLESCSLNTLTQQPALPYP